MFFYHLRRIHAVNVVRAEDNDVVRFFVIDEVERLHNGIRRAVVPTLTAALLGRHRSNVLRRRPRQIPRLGNVAVQGVGLVLGQHRNLEVAGVDQVGQDKVNEAVGSAKRHGGFGAVFGQGKKALSLAAGKDNG